MNMRSYSIIYIPSVHGKNVSEPCVQKVGSLRAKQLNEVKEISK